MMEQIYIADDTLAMQNAIDSSMWYFLDVWDYNNFVIYWRSVWFKIL